MKTKYTPPVLTEVHLSTTKMLAVSGPTAGGEGAQGDHTESKSFGGGFLWDDTEEEK